MRSRPPVTRLPLATFALALGLLAGCADTGAESATSGDPALPAGSSSPDSVPAAILGEAPPPRGQDVHYVAGDSATNGYLVAPEGTGPFSAVILIHEWDGLNDRVRQVADAFADEGYVALAVDLYQGRKGSTPEENRALTQEARANMPAVIANLDAAAAFVRARPDATGRVAAMGWCFGGGVALSYALGGEHHDGTAVFYGSLITDPDSLAALDHPIYGTFAGQDDGIPPAEVERFVEALRAAGVDNDVHVYDAVDHGFWLWVDRDPETNLAPAADAWRRLRAYLERTIG
ncbi:MAG TPA: dienelactone hydrolase family protein [Gemmatimonadota bacterium]|nr:dienelactone hydrolase family protein [Gemmatimonadota bacterium]